MIYLVRHGEAAADWGEHPDPGLSQKGRQQAGAVALKLREFGATNAISSPMLRCQETAHPFVEQVGLEVKLEPAISEIETPPNVSDRPAWLRDVMAEDWPESLQPWCERALSCIRSLPDGSVAFSHFIAINAIVGQLSESAKVLQFRPDHCSITKLARDGTGALTLVALGHEAGTKIL